MRCFHLMRAWVVFFALLAAARCAAQTFDFFRIQSAKYIAPPSKEESVLSKTSELNRENGTILSPYLTVAVSTGERTRAEAVYAKVYYYSKERVLLDKAEKPIPVLRGSARPHAMPVFFEKGKVETLYFAVPQKVLDVKDWRAVAVFGDQLAATALVWPTGFAQAYNFPERVQIDKPTRTRRETVADPVVEYVVKTGHAKQPQITLFMRPPIGMTDMSEADGVLAICLLANDVSEVKRRLQEADAKDDVSGILRFAEQRKLVVLCWGSRSLWDAGKNWDDLDRDTAREMDDTFNVVAAAWARGVETLARRYGMPDSGFLLWGMSGAAQYAQRLALRKPRYFLAIHAHIPSSFDKPTSDAAHVLWCLTTGECESGYERSLRFVSECKGMGYPILYKAIPGLGHKSHPAADRLGTVFFDYALGLREEKREYEEALSKQRSPAKGTRDARLPLPWPASFRMPEFIGDVVNQLVFRADEADADVPEAFRIAIPTKALADAWKTEI